MIDFQVAFDKLAQFETADNIANFLRGEGIVGFIKVAGHCPVAHWMQKQTQQEIFVSTNHTFGPQNDAVENSQAMSLFIHLFDHGLYSDLVTTNESFLCDNH